MTPYGPKHRWFAWYPVNTRDRGWVWLRTVARQRYALVGIIVYRMWWEHFYYYEDCQTNEL